MAFSPDDKLAEEFEQLLREGPKAEALQDRMMTALKWTERGPLINDTLVKAIEIKAREVLRAFLEEQPAFTVSAGMAPRPSCADDLRVVYDGAGRLTIEFPNEVRRWLLQTQSMVMQ